MQIATRQVVGVLFIGFAVLTGCASISRSGVPQSEVGRLSCSQITSELAQAEHTKRIAAEAKTGSWKAVIPIAVAMRYADAKAAGVNADQRIASLRERQQKMSCADSAN